MSDALAHAVTVVVLTYNRRNELLATLDRLTSLPEQPTIIVVDNASSYDVARDVRQHHPQISVVRMRHNLGAAARNHGVDCAVTPYVAFCDDDCWWAPGALAHAAATLAAHPQVAVLCACILVGPQLEIDRTSQLMARSPLRSAGLPGRAILGYMAGASVMRRAAYRQVGGYHEKLFLGGEEELVALDLAAAGWAMVYDERLLLHHHPSALRDAGKRRRLLLRNAMWIGWLRLPWPGAMRRMLGLLVSAESAGLRLKLLADCLSALHWLAAERRVLPLQVLQMRSQIEGGSQQTPDDDRINAATEQQV
jgi:GT2 family glycosyltransferase